MMNLLIAILSDTYGRVQSTRAGTSYLEKAKLLCEIESMLLWNREKGVRKYLHVVSVAAEKEDEGDTWEGKVTAMANQVNALKKQIDLNQQDAAAHQKATAANQKALEA